MLAAPLRMIRTEKKQKDEVSFGHVSRPARQSMQPLSTKCTLRSREVVVVAAAAAAATAAVVAIFSLLELGRRLLKADLAD